MSERYVMIGLADARSGWFARVSRWATEAVIPAEFLKAMSAEEVRARLDTGRRFSAVLLDAAVPTVDRDLLEAIHSTGGAAIVVTDPRVDRDWSALGARATLAPDFDRDHLVRLLATHARAVPIVDAGLDTPTSGRDDRRWQCPTVCVTGAPGSGRSTVAMALAQGLSRVGDRRPVALADFALDADLAVLTDVGDVVPGVQDLVEAHRLGTPTPDAVRSLLFPVEQGDYDLLAGLREPDDWPVLRRGSTTAALAGLRHAYRTVVIDHDPDLTGEAETGSRDLEDRNSLARAAAEVASVVLVVGTVSVQGFNRHLRISRRLLRTLDPAVAVAPIVNRCRRVPHRQDVRRGFAALAEAEERAIASPTFVGEVRNLETRLRDGADLPGAIVDPLVATVQRHLETPPRRRRRAEAGTPARIERGELGHWSDDGEAA